MAMLTRFMQLWLVSILSIYTVQACNNAICGPRVTKCLLLKSCECDTSNLKNCSCCRDCQICLRSLYTECCSCVGLCPPPDPDDDMAKGSSVEELPDPIPDLFKVLTEEEDPYQRWSTFIFGVDLDKLLFEPGTKMPSGHRVEIIGADKDGKEEVVLGIRNCTVAFFSDCMSMAKCKASCKSMGAAKYRWFHEHGCCQCVGSSCSDYGLSKPKCLQCPEDTEMNFRDGYMRDQWKENSVYQARVVDEVSKVKSGVDKF